MMAFDYIQKHGLTTEASYPYSSGKDGNNPPGKCPSYKAEYTITKHYAVKENDEQALMRAVVSQPVAVAIDASSREFMAYSGGVFDSCGTNVDHAVQLVGYGTDKATGKDYWLVRNSWGSDWGLDGYIKIARGTGKKGGVGTCGILTSPSYAVGGEAWDGGKTSDSENVVGSGSVSSSVFQQQVRDNDVTHKAPQDKSSTGSTNTSANPVFVATTITVGICGIALGAVGTIFAYRRAGIKSVRSNAQFEISNSQQKALSVEYNEL